MKKLLSIIILTFCLLIVFAPLAHAYDAKDPSTYYIANKETGKFHLPNCSYLPNEYNSYLVDVHNTSKLSSLSPCGHCDPLNNEIKAPTEEPRPQQHNDTSSNYMIILPLIFLGVSIIAIIPLIRRKEP